MPIGKVWIYRLLFVILCVRVCVCTVTDFCAEDKASSVKFRTAVYRSPRQGLSHFGELCSTRSPKWDTLVSVKDDECFSWWLHGVPIAFARFQAGCRRRRPNLALILRGFILCCSVFRYGCMFAFVVFVFVFQY